MRRRSASLLALLTLFAPTAAAAAPAPQTPVGRQVDWLLDVSTRLPVTEADARAHIASSFLDEIPVTQLNAVLTAVSGAGGLTLVRFEEQTATVARFVVSGQGRWTVTLSVDADGLIAGLLFAPFAPPPPTSWAALDARLHAVAPHVSLLAARVDADGDCRPVHGVAAGTPRPLGSAFKLWVLGALAEEIRAGRASWDEQLAIREDRKSLPSGVLQDRPAGTLLSLREYATYMIGSSDNTATDHLIGRLGRETVQRWRDSHGGVSGPLLTTRELFILRLTDYPRLQRRFDRLPAPRQPAFLRTVVDRMPLPAIADATGWVTPRGVDDVEWFASASQLCRVYAELARLDAADERVGAVLSTEDAGLRLDPGRWSSTWYKGGSEPGVMTLNYRARTIDGQAYVVSVLVSDPRRPFVENETLQELLSLVRGAFSLLAG